MQNRIYINYIIIIIYNIILDSFTRYWKISCFPYIDLESIYFEVHTETFFSRSKAISK